MLIRILEIVNLGLAEWTIAPHLTNCPGHRTIVRFTRLHEQRAQELPNLVYPSRYAYDRKINRLRDASQPIARYIGLHHIRSSGRQTLFKYRISFPKPAFPPPLAKGIFPSTILYSSCSCSRSSTRLLHHLLKTAKSFLSF